MKGNAKLYNVIDISNILQISQSAVRNRADKLFIKPITLGNNRAYWYDFNQFKLIENFVEPTTKADIVVKNVDTIVHHITWHIRDSKLETVPISTLASTLSVNK